MMLMEGMMPRAASKWSSPSQTGVEAEVFGEFDLIEDFAISVGSVLAGEAGDLVEDAEFHGWFTSLGIIQLMGGPLQLGAEVGVGDANEFARARSR